MKPAPCPERQGASPCVLITDHAALREKNGVRNPRLYLRSMTRRAQCGELHLHRSIFAILSKDKDQCDASDGAPVHATQQHQPAKNDM